MDIEKSNTNLTTDNYYTSIRSIPLTDYLLQKQIALVGTLKNKTREIPPGIISLRTKLLHPVYLVRKKIKILTSMFF